LLCVKLSAKRSLMNETSSMDQVFLERVHSAIENNFANESFGVDQLAHEIGISRSQLHRRLKVLSGQSPSQMIKEFRLSKAKDMLQNKVANVSEICYRVGFSSPSYFNTCFKEHFGYPPGKVKRIGSSGITRKHSISLNLIFVSVTTLAVVSSIVMFIIVLKKNTEINTAEINQNSIAVLPFINDSPEKENEYFLNGIMEQLLFKLQTIGDLRVISRNSVEQYRDQIRLPTPEIAEAMGVNYLIEGSGQKYGDTIILRIQLIEASTDSHLLAWSYEEQIESVEAITRIYAEISESIATELQAVITSKEKQLIEKPPTTSLTAYDFYLRGKAELDKFGSDDESQEPLERAENLYHKALEYDSTFALAYIGLARVYRIKHRWDELFKEEYMDSMLILVNRALSYNDQLAEAYVIRGDYYRYRSRIEQAIDEYDKAIMHNPNSWEAYYQKGVLQYMDDFVESLGNFHKAASLNRGLFLPSIYRKIAGAYGMSGFKEKCNFFLLEALSLDDDSATHYSLLANVEDNYSNFEKSIEFGIKSHAIDSTDDWIVYLIGTQYLYLGQFDKCLEYFKKYEILKKTFDRLGVWETFRLGYAYWINGFEEEAEYYFDSGLKVLLNLAEVDRQYFYQDFHNFYCFATIYAFRGDKDKAYENLRKINQRQRMPLWMVKDINNDPLFDNLRNDLEFQQIAKDIEAKYQAEHERVRHWLEENDML